MPVLPVKQQQIVVLINLKHKPMMMMKMNLFILNPVHVLDGKNDVKQLLNVTFQGLMHPI
jgi:hypothetical protein